MNSLEGIVWRNASYDGVVSFRVEVATLTKRKDVGAAQLERLAKAIKDALGQFGSMVRVEHVKYPG
jgi:hypothetical protein